MKQTNLRTPCEPYIQYNNQFKLYGGTRNSTNTILLTTRIRVVGDERSVNLLLDPTLLLTNVKNVNRKFHPNVYIPGILLIVKIISTIFQYNRKYFLFDKQIKHLQLPNSLSSKT